MKPDVVSFFFFFFNDTATTEIYTLSLHDALPIFRPMGGGERRRRPSRAHVHATGRSGQRCRGGRTHETRGARTEEHTSELQSQSKIVCRPLLEKKKRTFTLHTSGNIIYTVHDYTS